MLTYHKTFVYKIFTAFIAVMLALAVLPVKPVYAAATQLDAWTNISSTGASANSTSINAGNLTVTAGTNRIFVTALCMELSGANTFSSISSSLGGTGLTQIGTTTGTSAQEHCYMGYLLESQIPAGSNTLTVTYNISGTTTTITGMHVDWASFSGINQITPINDSNANTNGAANVTFGAQIDYVLNGLTFYAAGNLGAPATMTAPAGFTQGLLTTTNGHSSFIGSITTVPHASSGSYLATTNVAFGGTTGARSSLVVASLRPIVSSTTVGVATATAATANSILVTMPYTFDDNTSNTYTVEYKLSSDVSWTAWVTGAAHTASPYTTTITGLVSSTSYDVRVTWIDADGVTGTNPQTISNVVTPAPACSGSYTYNAPAGANRVVVVVASVELGTAISNVQIGGVAATSIATVTNGNAQIYTGYRVIGTSAVAQAMNVTTTGATCTFATSYQNINQTAGNGVSNTINSIATGTAASGTTTTSVNVFNAAAGAVINVAGGQVVYAINMNQGSADGQVSTGTSSAWTFNELMDKYDTNGGNRTAVGQSNATTAGSAAVSVGDGGVAQNRSVLVAFALNPTLAQTITVTTAAPASAAYGSTFPVAATASSGLGVAITTTGGCSGSGTGSATITMTSSTVACVVHYNQAGNGTYSAAPEVTNSTTAQKATPTATLTVNNSPVTYDGSPHSAIVIISVSSVPGSVANILTGGAATQTTANTYVVTADFVPTDSTNYNTLIGLAAGNFIIGKATPTATLAVNNSPVTYDASPHSATVAISVSSVPGSVANILTGGAATQTSANTYAVTADFVPTDSTNYNTLSGLSAGNFIIGKATPTATLTVNNSPVTYDASPHSAIVIISVSSVPGSVANILTGGAATQTTANTYAVTADFVPTDSTNYNTLIGLAAGNFIIGKATLTVTATGVDKIYDGTTTATVTLSDNRVTGDVFTESYTSASFAPDASVGTGKTVNVSGISISGGASGNYTLANTTASTTANILADGTTTSITNAVALATATIAGQSYPVTFTVTPNTGGTPTGNVTVSDGTDNCIGTVLAGTCNLTSTTSGVKSLTAAYGGDSNFVGSTSAGVSHTVNEAPAITSLDHATFTVATAGPAFSVTTSGYPAPSITPGGAVLPSGITFLDDGNGTGTLNGTPATGMMGTYLITFTAANGIGSNAVQNFTLTIAGGPTIPTNGVNTTPDTGDGHLAEFEVVTVGITKFTVTFNQDVINVLSTDPNYGKSVINPANYMLVRDNGDGFQTVDCASGVALTDTAITIDSITYSNSGGSGPFVATLNVNSGLPLSNGNYRVYICGTTSITNLGGLKLAGNGTLEGTDFIRNFIVQLPNNGGGGNGGGAGYQGVYTVSLLGLIPVTGFAPGRPTLLPAQPADSAYSSNTGLRMEIPVLGVNVPIVGVAYKNNNWDLTWLKNNAGYLDGSAYPTWSGNSVLTGHLMDAAGAPGPFAYIKDLQIGDKIKIHFGGQVFVYEVRENRQVLPTALATVFQHENYNWLTLVTCEDYNNATKTYNYRRYARAVLVSVIPEK